MIRGLTTPTATTTATPRFLAECEYAILCQQFPQIDYFRSLLSATDDPTTSDVRHWSRDDRLALYRLAKRIVGSKHHWRQYRKRLRSIIFNLCHSPEIKRRYLMGELTVKWLVNASEQERWPERWLGVALPSHLQREIVSVTQKEAQTTTAEFKCGKCGERKCTYVLAQTRSADEGMTQIVTCVVCNNRWKMG